MTGIFFIISLILAWGWAQEKVMRKKREDRIPKNIQKIYWNLQEEEK